MYGGNDGINTVIPYADNAYHDARPELAYAPGDVLHLDDQLGLNPALKGLAQQWNRRKLAIVRGVGYPQPDHSHFRSMDVWQTASPSEPVSTGWIGRWLDATGNDPLRAVNIGAVLPPLAIGAKGHGRGALALREARSSRQIRGDDDCARRRRPPRHTGDGGGVRRISGHPHYRHGVRRDQAVRREAQLVGRPAHYGGCSGQGRGAHPGLPGEHGRIRHARQRTPGPSSACCRRSTRR